MDPKLAAIFEAVLEGDMPGAKATIQAALDAGLAPNAILNDGMIAAMAEAGYRLPPTDVEAFLIAHGYPARLAAEAREFAQRIKDGHSLRKPSVGVMRKDIVEIWRAESKEMRPVD